MKAPSLAARAVLAVALMVGFYVLAIGVAAGLLYIPYAEWHYVERVDARIAVACIAGAFGILVGIMPRIDKFDPPGVELQSASQPRLFAVLDAIAAATKQARPKSVYLISDLNAWVAQRGGLMGFGSRRVMAIGLPLLETLSVGELRGVIAHEYGHYHGGDTALGPWIYKTRAAIERTVNQLRGHTALIQKPFIVYGNAFLRVTLAISRRQEYAADALAAGIVGADAVARGLATLHRTGPAFGTYWRTEVSPVLAAGFRPPVVDGLRDFLAQPVVEEMTSTLLAQELGSGKADRYDSHPALRERLSALTALGPAPAPPSSGAASDSASALSLLDSVETLEAELARTLAPKERRNKLVAVAWADVGEQVWIPQWQRVARAKMPYLRGLTLAGLADPKVELRSVAGAVGVRTNDKDQRALQIAEPIGAAIIVALHSRGWALDAMPGRPVTLSKNGITLAPFVAIQEWATGAMTPQSWREWAAQSGLSDTDFSALVPSPHAKT